MHLTSLYRNGLVTCLLAAWLLSGTAFAQYSEAGVFGGGALYFGDLNPNYQIAHIEPAIGLLYRYNINPYLVVRTSLTQGQLSFDDQTTPLYWNQRRNLRFFTPVTELSQQIEFNFFGFNKLDPETFFSPYLTAGLSLFRFNPSTRYQGRTYNLQPLGTEGQNTPSMQTPERYALTQMAIPVGGGLKFSLNAHWNINLEVSIHNTLTDYLDDVSGVYPDPKLIRRYQQQDAALVMALSDRSSETGEAPIGKPGKQRGVSSRNDQFFFFGIIVSYTFWTIPCPY